MNHKMIWTFAISSIAVFMVTLDNLVVTTALPVIRGDLHAGLSGLEWTVNAYTLTFAVLLMTGAALGDRLGRRRMFVFGLSVFTLASAAAPPPPPIAAPDVPRALQGFRGGVGVALSPARPSPGPSAERRRVPRRAPGPGPRIA